MTFLVIRTTDFMAFFTQKVCCKIDWLRHISLIFVTIKKPTIH